MRGVQWALLFFIFSCSSNSRTTEASGESEKPSSEWIVLFDGGSLDQWHEYNANEGDFENWSVQDGVLELKSTSPSTRSLITNEVFSSFVLTLEWKVDSMANTGIFWGVQEDSEFAEPFLTGIEAQLLDNSSYPDRPMIQKTGSVFNLVEASIDAYKGPNIWNSMKIKIDLGNNMGLVDLNGQITATFPVRGPEWDSLLSNSPYSHWSSLGKNLTGKIGLQEYGHSASFRNIKIKRL